MVLNYCDDQIWLSPDNKLIEEHVKKLQELKYDLVLEEKVTCLTSWESTLPRMETNCADPNRTHR